MWKTGLSPVVDEETEILILGTLPSDQSIAAAQYYATASNDFWRIIGSALGEALEGLGYDARIAILRSHGIGLWDAFGACVRPGSMDKDISAQELNDFGVLKDAAPKLRLVCFNGQGAAKAENAIRDLGYETCRLLSSSGANRKRRKERETAWKSVLCTQVRQHRRCHTE